MLSRRARTAAVAVAAALAAAATPAIATFPFPADQPGADPYDYTRLRIEDGSCDPQSPHLPPNFDCKNDWKLTSYAAKPGDPDYDPTVANNPQELHGVKGSSTNLAWEVTTGRPDTVIAVLDSGIRWDENRPNLVNKYFLNAGELPVPKGASRHDANNDGVFNVKDYANDPRARDLPDDGNAFLDPSDLIRTFSDGVDGDRNGYVDDISGWDFFEGDNDANDDVDYGHGTGESEDSAGETGIDIDPQCPNCMLLEMRVGDSFIADVNHFAEAVVYTVDNGASVIQSALGTLNNTSFAQRAVDYAYANGVMFMASQADESAGHHNMPSALNHTVLANSVTKPVAPGLAPQSYLQFNGCTNFGGYSWITVASSSCSSDAIGQSSGIAGLLYSAARNEIDRGRLAQRTDTGGRPLSAEEAKQLFRLAADDVDFSTPEPPFPPNNFATSLPASQRFVTTAGWDQVTGWGRLNANTAVRLVAALKIPPEADIVAPRWWQTLPARGTVDVVGRVAAPRLKAGQTFSWQVQYAPGVQAGCPGGCATDSPVAAADTWTTVASGSGRTAPLDGVLAQLDLAKVRADIEAANLARPAYNPLNDPTSRDLPEQDAVRVRVLACVGTCPAAPDYDPTVAIEQRQYFVRDDPALLPGWPRFLDGDGAGSAAFDDLDGDDVDEMIVADGNGLVHAYKADGREAAGWPQRTTIVNIPSPHGGRKGRMAWLIPGRINAAVLTGAPTVADLDGDGSPEVAVADIEGRLHVWTARGEPVRGFPVRTNPAYSIEPPCQGAKTAACDDYSSTDVRDRINTVDRAFTAQAAAGDLDPSYPGLELVAGANDGHVYAWHADGNPVAGWPVLLRDPAKVASVDPVTHKIAFVDDSGVEIERKVIASPTLADIDSDADLEVLVNVNEQYREEPNASRLREHLQDVLGSVADPGNTRVYALHHDGAAHEASEAQNGTPHPHDQAYVAGWPVRIAMVQVDLLPYVGAGSNGSPVVADVDGDGTVEIATASIASPPYLLKADGSSYYGTGPDGKYLTMATSLEEFRNPTATDGPSFASLGGGAFGRLAGGATGPSFAMGATGLRRLLDVVLPEQQLGAEDHLSVWESRTGSYLPGFPAQVNDLMFFNTPAFADVTGDGRAEVLQSTAMYDLRAYGLGGVPAAGWPRHTGGWSVAAPGVGDLNGDGRLDVALNTREGNLFVWSTAGDACQAPEWPKHQGNLRNTGQYGVDAKRPGVPVIGALAPDRRTLLVRASGDDGRCGQAAAWVVTVNGRAVPVGSPAPSGTWSTVDLGQVGPGPVTVRVQLRDDAGNLGFAATKTFSGPTLAF